MAVHLSDYVWLLTGGYDLRCVVVVVHRRTLPARKLLLVLPQWMSMRKKVKTDHDRSDVQYYCEWLTMFTHRPPRTCLGPPRPTSRCVERTPGSDPKGLQTNSEPPPPHIVPGRYLGRGRDDVKGVVTEVDESRAWK